jgi:hypothetical protein
MSRMMRMMNFEKEMITLIKAYLFIVLMVVFVFSIKEILMQGKLGG